MRSASRIVALAEAAVVLAAAAVAAMLTSGDASARPAGGTLRLVAYSTPREAYAKLIPAFAETTARRGTSFEQSYGASGEQARAVIAGLKADVIALARAGHDLAREGRPRRQDVEGGPVQGMVTRSVVVFAVRKGNPKNIRSWADLIKPDVDVVTRTSRPPAAPSGTSWLPTAPSGRSGSTTRTRCATSSASTTTSSRRTRARVRHSDVPRRPRRRPDRVRERGHLRPEEEPASRLRDPKGDDLDRESIAVTKRSGNRTTARAFVTYVRSKPGQVIFGENGYRPVLRSARSSSASRSLRGSSRSSSSAAGRRSTSSSSTPVPGSSRGSRRGRAAEPGCPRRSPRPTGGGARSRCRDRHGARDRVPEPDRPPAARRRRVAGGGKGGWSGFWEAVPTRRRSPRSS